MHAFNTISDVTTYTDTELTKAARHYLTVLRTLLQAQYGRNFEDLDDYTGG